MAPVACLITDRLRLPEPSPAGVLRQVRAAVDAGVPLVQIRERDLDGGALLALAGEAVSVARGSRTRIVVNDRLDVALAAGAAGVHLRAGSCPAARVRAIVPAGFLIGRSVHGLDDLGAAVEGADYLIFGTVFESASKPGRRPAGLAALAAVAAATPLPVLAVGGITADRVAAVCAAGAAGYAAITMFSENRKR